jgi:glycerol uptake facilitator-like aquaporin
MRKLTSEFIGTYLLALAIVGAGIMATSITQDGALRLLINALVAAGTLALIINAFGGISGGHFNPAVTVVAFSKKELSLKKAGQYVSTQILGGILGVVTANYFFELDLVSSKSNVSVGSVAIVSEVFSTLGLLFVIRHLINIEKSQFIPVGVALWIFTGYFFTPTSVVANPAMALARTFTDSYAGIPVNPALAFVGAQLIGALLGAALADSLKKKKKK